MDGQLLLIEDERLKSEKQKNGQLLLTRDEWLKRSNTRGCQNGGDYRGKEGVRTGRDRSKVRCFNCLNYGHYAA